MKKLIALVAVMLMAGGASGALAAKPDNAGPGPNGNNDHGLCTAYFNGQKNGHDKHGSPGPFAALEDAAGAEDGDSREEIAYKVYEFCQAAGIGGNPTHGRFDCETTSDTDEDDNLECANNPSPGNS